MKINVNGQVKLACTVDAKECIDTILNQLRWQDNYDTHYYTKDNQVWKEIDESYHGSADYHQYLVSDKKEDADALFALLVLQKYFESK
jgi:hypothetical protein